MRALLLEAAGSPHRLSDLPCPQPGLDRVLIRVHAYSVCRTDWHVVDGELPDPKLPLVPCHNNRQHRRCGADDTVPAT